MPPILIYLVVLFLINIILAWKVGHDSYEIADSFPIMVNATCGWLMAISMTVLIGLGVI